MAVVDERARVSRQGMARRADIAASDDIAAEGARGDAPSRGPGDAVEPRGVTSTAPTTWRPTVCTPSWTTAPPPTRWHRMVEATEPRPPGRAERRVVDRRI
jgi:hypothetical protein